MSGQLTEQFFPNCLFVHSMNWLEALSSATPEPIWKVCVIVIQKHSNLQLWNSFAVFDAQVFGPLTGASVHGWLKWKFAWTLRITAAPMTSTSAEVKPHPVIGHVKIVIVQYINTSNRTVFWWVYQNMDKNHSLQLNYI